MRVTHQLLTVKHGDRLYQKRRGGGAIGHRRSCDYPRSSRVCFSASVNRDMLAAMLIHDKSCPFCSAMAYGGHAARKGAEEMISGNEVPRDQRLEKIAIKFAGDYLYHKRSVLSCCFVANAQVYRVCPQEKCNLRAT